MLHLGGLDLLALVVVAGQAESLGVGLGQDHLTVLGGRVAGIAAIALERCVLKLRHQLGRVGLVRIVALHAVGAGERLVVMRLLELFVVGVVAIEAERRARLGQVELVVLSCFRSGLVGHMAGIAAHVEGGVTASLLRYMQSSLVALAAEIFFFAAG